MEIALIPPPDTHVRTVGRLTDQPSRECRTLARMWIPLPVALIRGPDDNSWIRGVMDAWMWAKPRRAGQADLGRALGLGLNPARASKVKLLSNGGPSGSILG